MRIGREQGIIYPIVEGRCWKPSGNEIGPRESASDYVIVIHFAMDMPQLAMKRTMGWHFVSVIFCLQNSCHQHAGGARVISAGDRFS